MSRITIHDVSKAAGVSIKTVSRVLNSEPNVRSETRARVLKLVEELNYHPSLSARSLAGRSSNLIGLIYQNPSANYVVDLQKGALERCHTRGYRLLVHPCEGADVSSVRDLAGLVLESHLDGVVLAHGANAKRIGTNQIADKDPDGKAFVKERVELAATHPSF